MKLSSDPDSSSLKLHLPFTLCSILLAVSIPRNTQAQPAAPPTEATVQPSDPAAEPAMPAPPTAPPPPVAPTPPASPAATVPEPLPPMAETPPTVGSPGLLREPKSISSTFGIRVGGRIQGANDPEKLDDVSMDTAYLEARFSGSVNKYFAWHANFNGVAMPSSTSGTAGLMDLVIRMDLADYFHIWAGRLLVPSDRSNFSGPFFMSPWSYPGVYGPTFIGPKTGANGRDDGVVVWGQVLGAKAKYFLGAFNLDRAGVSPLYSGRINIALLGDEPGLWGSSTYYGDKDVVAIGGALQYQKNGSGTIDPVTTAGTRDLTIAIGDLLAEKSFAGAGTATLEAAYYFFDEGQPARHAFFVLGSFLTSTVGVGKLQPLVRWQQTSPQTGGSKMTILDAFLAYVIHGYDLRVLAGYQRMDLGNSTVANAIQVGLQIQE